MRNGLAVLITLLYPVLVYWGIGQVRPRYLALGLMLAFLLRWKRGAGEGRGGFLIAGGAFFAAAGWVDHSLGLLAYPVFVNAAFLALFAHSLLNPPTIAERLARLEEPDLPPQGVAYTRKVTLVWCGFFLGNGLISALTVWYGDIALWGLYNGLISYILIGLLMGAEMRVRKRVRKSLRHA